MGASRLDVFPIEITIVSPLLIWIRTVEATNPEPTPRFGAAVDTLLQIAESQAILSDNLQQISDLI